MIVLKNLELIVGENKTLPLDKGGELENYVSKPLQQILLDNFGIQCVVEIKKE